VAAAVRRLRPHFGKLALPIALFIHTLLQIAIGMVAICVRDGVLVKVDENVLCPYVTSAGNIGVGMSPKT
jgi:hypothetical protein